MRKRTVIYISIILNALICLNVNLYSQQADKNRREDTFKKAERYFYQRKFEMAELLFEKELKKNPENEDAYSYLGDICLNKRKFNRALKLYKKALDINPDKATDYFRIGQIYYHKKNSARAIKNFEKALDLDNNLKFAHFHIGLTYLMLLRDKDNTIKSWQTFIDIDLEDPQREKIRRAIELLRDPNFTLPEPGSEISIEEALHLGGVVIKGAERKAKDKKLGHEKKKTKNKLEDIYKDDAL